jgi:hypothetical protein
MLASWRFEGARAWSGSGGGAAEEAEMEACVDFGTYECMRWNEWSQLIYLTGPVVQQGVHGLVRGLERPEVGGR